ncbi:hypothetical protein SALBM311S_04676 [Streptomyces alboniger]
MPSGPGVLQLAGEAVHMGVEKLVRLLEYLLVGQPSDGVELALVVEVMVSASAVRRYQSETSVCALSLGSGDGEEEGTLTGDRRCHGLDAQLLTAFAIPDP